MKNGVTTLSMPTIRETPQFYSRVFGSLAGGLEEIIERFRDLRLLCLPVWKNLIQ